jgi:hypothetical protein
MKNFLSRVLADLTILHKIVILAIIVSGGALGWFLPYPPAVKTPTVAESGVNLFVYDDSLDQFAVDWQNELNRRFTQPTIALMCHGGGPLASEWLAEDNPGGSYGTTCELVTILVDRIHAEHKDCLVVLVSCNPNHVMLHGRPWLFISPGLVWCEPDRAVKPFVNSAETIDPPSTQPDAFDPNETDNRSVQCPTAIGNAFEFIECN